MSCNGHSIDLFSTNSRGQSEESSKLVLARDPQFVFLMNLKFNSAPLSQVLDTIKANGGYTIEVKDLQ